MPGGVTPNVRKIGDRVHRIAVIPGDGTGPEVVAEGLKVLEAAAAAAGFDFETTYYDFGGRPVPGDGGDAPRRCASRS